MEAAQILALLREKSLQLATAESCTAGLLSAAVTAVPGASAVFTCGVAAYSNEIKKTVLGVPAATIDTVGAVSAETAIAMADGVRRLANASIGVSVTGVAGPATEEGKPVGTVFLALANADRVWVRELQPDPACATRDAVREKAVAVALEMIAQYAAAYPAMTAGSLPLTSHTPKEVEIPQAAPIEERRRFLAVLLPWKGDTPKERVLKLCLPLFVCMLIAVAFFSVKRLLSVSGNQSLYSDLQNMYIDNTNTDTETVASGSDILPRFTALYAQNADIGGWIRIDGTDISYPVMKNAGSDYYATHNFRQQYSDYGVPYFDRRNTLVSAQSRNRVLIVYGNNTGDGQMFSSLLNYRRTDFFKEHAIIDMSTLYAADKWQLFAVMVLDPDEINAFAYAQTAFADDDAFKKYIEEVRSRSLLNTSVVVTPADDLLLLVTQAEDEYGFENATFVAVARRLRENETAADITVGHNPTVRMPRIWVRRNYSVSTTASKMSQTSPATTTATVTVPSTSKSATTASAPPTTKPTTTTSTAPPTSKPTTATTADEEDKQVDQTP